MRKIVGFLVVCLVLTWPTTGSAQEETEPQEGDACVLFVAEDGTEQTGTLVRDDDDGELYCVALTEEPHIVEPEPTTTWPLPPGIVEVPETQEVVVEAPPTAPPVPVVVQPTFTG